MANEPGKTEIRSETLEPLKKWPSKETYFHEMENEISENREALEAQLIEHGYSKELVPEIATVVLRGQFTYNFLKNITLMDAKVATEIVWTKVLPRNTRATTTAILTESGEELENFDDALNRARNDKKIDLKSIKIGVNLDEIDGSVRQAHRYREIYLNQNTGDDDGANKFMENMLEETSIKTELAVVEEVAHSLFMSSVFKTKSTTLGWLEEHKGYMSHIPGTENDLIQILSEDEIKILQKSYDTKRVEVKAEVLVDLFKRKYYPDFDIEI